MVEYDGYNKSTTWEYDEPEIIELKVDKNNCITITKVKDSWTREEVHNLLMQAWVHGQANSVCHYEIREKWIEENL